MDTMTIIIGALALALALSEFLSIFPSVAANGIFQAVTNILKSIYSAIGTKNK